MKKILLSLLSLGATLSASAQLYIQEGASTEPFAPKMKLKDHGRIAKPTTAAPHKANYNQTDIVPDGESMVYGFTKYDLERWYKTYSFYKFSTDKPYNQDMTKIADFFPNLDVNWVPEITALTFVGDELWANMIRPFSLGQFYECGFYNMNQENGEYSERLRLFSDDAPEIPTDLNKYKDDNMPYILDASYDPTTGLLWYVAPELNAGGCFDGWARPTAWNFGYFDIKNGKKKPVKLGYSLGAEYTGTGKNQVMVSTSIEQLTNIVADHGKLYTVQNIIYKTDEVDSESGASIWDTRSRYICITPDVENGTYTMDVIREYDSDELWVLPTDFMGVVVGSALEMDRDNRRLYFAYSSNYDSNAYLSELDIKTGRVLKTEMQGGAGFAVTTIAMPYQDCKDDAPANVTGLTVVAGINGANNCTLSWTNPTGSYYDRAKDPKLQGINIYRGDELITTLDPEETSFIDVDVPYGLYKYTVVPFNATGEGLKEARTAFVGRDLPGAPLNVTLTANGNTGTLTWEEPATGLHGTWYDKSTLTYDITRLPDNVSVATNLQGNTFTDNVTETYGYSYTVTAKNHEGVGLSATSNIVTYGPAIKLPYFADFSNETDFNTWEVVDHNKDGFKWEYKEFGYGGQGETHGAIYDATFCGNSPSDYFMSPVLDCKAGEKYKIEYNVMVHNYKDTEEDFGWYNGNENAYPGNSDLNLFEEGHYTSMEALKWHTRQGIFEADEDLQRIAFSVRSKPLMGILYLKDVNVRLYSDCDLRAVAIEGSAIGTKDKALPYTIKVKNEGKKTVRNFKIRVYDENKTSVAEQEFNVAIYSEETMSFVVNWTPKEYATTNLYAEVIVDGDTFPYDNVTPKPVSIDIAETDGDWRTVGVNDYYGTGWCAINKPYSVSQALYLSDELLLEEGAQITGIGFIYQGMPELATFKNVEFEVSVGNSGLEMIYDWEKQVTQYSYTPRLLKNSYFPTTVFYGFTDYSKTQNEGQLLFEFDEPFEYEGDNLLIQIIRCMNTKITEDPVLFQLQKRGTSVDFNNIGDPNGRALFQFSDTQIPEGSKGFVPGDGNNCLPVLCIGYTTKSGIKGIKTLGGDFNINSRQGELEFNDVCTNVVVTDLQGRIVARADKAQTVKVPASLSGACIVTATLSDGTTLSQKAIVK